jgi:hypothetical protein
MSRTRLQRRVRIRLQTFARVTCYTGRYSGFDAIGASSCYLSIQWVSMSDARWLVSELNFRRQAHEEVLGHLKAQPVGGHTWRNFEQIWCEAFVEALESFLKEDGFYGASHGCVLESHTSHGVDLKSSAEDVTIE